MSSAKNGQRALRLSPPVSRLRREVQAFLIDRQARGRSPRTVSNTAEIVAILQAFLEVRDVSRVQDITAEHLCLFLLAEAEARSPGGLHGLHRSARVFLRRWQMETERRRSNRFQPAAPYCC